MKPIKIRKALIALLLVGATHIAMGSFTGTTTRKSKDLYSLSSFNKNFYKTVSPFSLRAGFEYKGSQLLSQRKDASNNMYLVSMLRYEKGNTTYIYPYSHKVSAPRFVTPTPPTVR